MIELSSVRIYFDGQWAEGRGEVIVTASPSTALPVAERSGADAA
jgi:hypothetical protein